MTDVSTPDDGVPGAPGPAGDQLREQLLRAAAAVFARQGYDGTKIMDIVRESGLSTGAVYGRFRSKNDLLREAIVTRSSSAARLGADGIDRVADLIAAGVAHPDRPLGDAEALRLEAYVTARREPEVAQALAEANTAFRERMAPLAVAARRDGTVDEEAWQALVERLVASFGRQAPAGLVPDHDDAPVPTTTHGHPEDTR